MSDKKNDVTNIPVEKNENHSDFVEGVSIEDDSRSINTEIRNTIPPPNNENDGDDGED